MHQWYHTPEYAISTAPLSFPVQYIYSYPTCSRLILRTTCSRLILRTTCSSLHFPQFQADSVAMSLMTNSATYMGQAIRTGAADADAETFHKFFECWIVEQDQHLQELVSALNELKERQQKRGQDQDNEVGTQQEEEERILRPLVERVVGHYEQYYQAKARWARNNILTMYNPTWRSSLEDAFMWVGGWRPSMAFHLLYSKSGLQLEARLVELIRGFATGDLGDLSPSQLEQVNEMQQETIREEKEISEKLAKQQETVADTTMVELSHFVSEMIREGDVDRGRVIDDGRVEATLGPKEEALAEILQKADDLRLKTLKKVVSILTPKQGVHFLIAAAELHLRFHDWGKKRDTRHHQNFEHGHVQR